MACLPEEARVVASASLAEWVLGFVSLALTSMDTGSDLKSFTWPQVWPFRFSNLDLAFRINIQNGWIAALPLHSFGQLSLRPIRKFSCNA